MSTVDDFNAALAQLVQTAAAMVNHKDTVSSADCIASLANHKDAVRAADVSVAPAASANAPAVTVGAPQVDVAVGHIPCPIPSTHARCKCSPWNRRDRPSACIRPPSCTGQLSLVAGSPLAAGIGFRIAQTVCRGRLHSLTATAVPFR